MNQPILQTKLYIPPSHTGLVPRTRLWQQLNENFGEAEPFQRKLTLVSAPPGFGKTSLIADWLRQNGRTPAWLSLDETDNDSSRFQIYLIAARCKNRLEALVSEIQQEYGVQARALEIDLTKPDYLDTLQAATGNLEGCW